jgi:enoyl-CoA hydratase/carnithine racemase
MSYEDILYDKQDQTAIITLNQPERLNAVTWVMGQEMLQALELSIDVPGEVPGNMPELMS